jgi:hypothetical protein
MRRVIRSKRTRQYLRKDGTWTRFSETAKDFSNAADAVTAKERYRLGQVEIVLQMLDAPHPRYDVIVPLDDVPLPCVGVNTANQIWQAE